jgi:hypothetical protein
MEEPASGGARSDNFAADRELARKMLEIYPPVAEMARENR